MRFLKYTIGQTDTLIAKLRSALQGRINNYTSSAVTTRGGGAIKFENNFLERIIKGRESVVSTQCAHDTVRHSAVMVSEAGARQCSELSAVPSAASGASTSTTRVGDVTMPKERLRPATYKVHFGRCFNCRCLTTVLLCSFKLLVMLCCEVV